MHDELAARPWAAELLTADDLLGESALWMVEAMLGGARDCGCTPEQAVDLYRHVWYYTIGEILIRVNTQRRRASDDRPTYRDTVFSNLDAAHLPQPVGRRGSVAGPHRTQHLSGGAGRRVTGTGHALTPKNGGRLRPPESILP